MALQRRGCSKGPGGEQEFVRPANGERAFGTEGTVYTDVEIWGSCVTSLGSCK